MLQPPFSRLKVNDHDLVVREKFTCDNPELALLEAGDRELGIHLSIGIFNAIITIVIVFIITIVIIDQSPHLPRGGEHVRQRCPPGLGNAASNDSVKEG